MSIQEIQEAIKDGRLSFTKYIGDTAYVLYSEDVEKGPHHENKYVYKEGCWVYDSSLEGDLIDALGGEEGETRALNALDLADSEILSGIIVVEIPHTGPTKAFSFDNEEAHFKAILASDYYPTREVFNTKNEWSAHCEAYDASDSVRDEGLKLLEQGPIVQSCVSHHCESEIHKASEAPSINDLAWEKEYSDCRSAFTLTYEEYFAGPSNGGVWDLPIRKAAYDLDWVSEY